MAIQAMNIAIKNNNAMRPKRHRFNRTFGGYGKNRKPEFDFPQASLKQLNAIRERLKEEEKTRMLKVIILTVILIFGMLCVCVYSADGMVELLTY
jgi:hypothetical protein